MRDYGCGVNSCYEINSGDELKNLIFLSQFGKRQCLVFFENPEWDRTMEAHWRRVARDFFKIGTVWIQGSVGRKWRRRGGTEGEG